MLRIIMIFVLVLALSVMLPAAGEAQSTAGYEVTVSAPVSGMLPIDHTFSIEVLDGATGLYETRMMRVERYVIWIQPIRPPEYLCVLDGTPSWFILNRATIDGG